MQTLPRFRLVLLLALLLLLVSCSGPTAPLPGALPQAAAVQDSPKTVAYKSLATMSKTYTTTMQTIADLYKQGLVNDQIKAQAIKYGNAFKKAEDQVITQMEAGGDFSLSGVSAALADLLALAQPYLLKAVH
jgi:ABC-type glycerol-3-phosphate transport system substrate-binding protein